MMKKWKENFDKLAFDRKMQFIITIAIMITTALVLSISVFFSITSMRKQSIKLLKSQNETIVENFKDSLNTYKALAVATILDNAVQQYVKLENASIVEETLAAQNATNILKSINNIYSNLNFIALVSDDEGKYLYAGKDAYLTTKFLQVYESDEKNCKFVRQGMLKIGYNNAYYDGKKYTLNIYFPIYDSDRIFVKYGLLCMNFRDTNLEQILGEEQETIQKTYVIDTSGMFVAAGNVELIGSYIDYIEKFSDESGQFEENGKLYIYQKIKDWNYYVVNTVPMKELYRSSVQTIIIMFGLMIVVLFIATKLVKDTIQVLYYPLNKVVKKMDDVALGELQTRINVANMGEDFTKLALGFNSMMDEIQVLMEQVKLEQHQLEQIRFNALQSQIQPHFLYNTLECIHWQAIADGNKEISTLVKALAKYYRICLSNGADVISIEMELEHIKNYLIIQNMRYDNIIGSYFQVDEEAKSAMIPKLTLQPLVENAIYHGLKVKEGKTGSLYISVQKENELILIKVSDTGIGMEQEKIDEMNHLLAIHDDSFGYGVRNVNKRIELFYGKEYGLRFSKNQIASGLMVEIRLPYMTKYNEKNYRRGEADV